MKAIAEERKPIAGFDGLRAVCITLVIIHHSKILPWEGDLGGLGVYIFFALSGYLIIPALHRQRIKIEEGRSSPAVELKAFIARRAVRIFPAYYGALLLIVVPIFLASYIMGSAIYTKYSSLLPHLFAYTSNIHISYVLGDWPGNFSHFWSLAVEQQFYVLFPLTFIVLPTRVWPSALTVFVVCCAVVAIGLYDNELKFYAGTLTGFAAIGLGGIAALSERRVPARPLPLLVVGSAIYIGALLMGQVQAGIFIAACIFPLALKAIASRPHDRFVTFLETAPLRFVGAISYGFYIYHNLMMLASSAIAKQITGLRPDGDEYVGAAYYAIILIVGYGFSLAAAVLSYIFIEKPILRFRLRTD